MNGSRFQIQLLAPVLIFGVCTGLLSACAASAASHAAEKVGSSMETASTYAGILPSSTDSVCASCENNQVEILLPPQVTPPSSASSKDSTPEESPSDEHEVAPEPTSDSDTETDSFETEPVVSTPTRMPAALDAPLCPGISAYIISDFEDPRYSIATLSSDPKSQGTRRRIGQEYGEYRVIEIAFNRRHMSSAVWLQRDDLVCQVQLREDHPKRERAQFVAVRRYQRKAKAERLREERARKQARKKRARKRRVRKKRVRKRR